MEVPTLQRLALATLIRFRDALGDIGYAPVELLQDVLAACSPQQLAAIEDETLEGTGRMLKPWTWHFWREHWQRQFEGSFGAPAPIDLPLLPPAAEVAAGEPGVRPADYRALYERCQAELEQKRAESGARLRALREQAEQERQARHTLVVDPGTVAGRRRRQHQRPGPASSRGGGSNASHRPLALPVGSSKERLLKKLGLSGGSRRHAAAQPRKTVTVIHPARAPMAAGLQACRSSVTQAGVSSPNVLPQPLAQGPLRSPAGSLHSPAGSLASAGSSPLPWHQVQAARGVSTPFRQQLLTAASGTLARQQAQAASSSPRGQQRAQQQQRSNQSLGPRLVADGNAKPPVLGFCSSALSPTISAVPECPQLHAWPLPPPQQQAAQPGSQGAAAVQRKPARPAKPQALEEVDLFAGLEEATVQPRVPPPKPAAQLQPKQVIKHRSDSKGSRGSRGTHPPAKRSRPQQPAAPLLEVDLFDGL